MSRKKEYPGGIRLTLKKARELAIREFGTAKGLEVEPCAMPGYFHMRFGNLFVRIHPDVCGSGCIKVDVSCVSGYGYCTQFYNPDTLKQDFEAEEQYRREVERDSLKDWIDTQGPEFCHAAVDRIWNQGG